MNGDESAIDESLIEQALRSASHTRRFIAQAGVRHFTADVFAAEFGSATAVVVADENTFAAAGEDVCGSFARVDQATTPAFVFGPHAYADGGCVLELEAA